MEILHIGRVENLYALIVNWDALNRVEILLVSNQATFLIGKNTHRSRIQNRIVVVLYLAHAHTLVEIQIGPLL